LTNPSMDMSQFAEAQTDRITADDLIGGPRTVKITAVQGAVEEGKKRATINFEGDDGKPFKPCKTMVRLMMAVWGKYASDYVGRSMTLYRDPEVTFGALATGGVRISHMSHMDSDTTVIIALKKGKKGAIKVSPLIAEVQPIRGGKQTADQWAAEQAKQALDAATMDDLSNIMATGEKAMAKLEKQSPELWADVNQAYATRRAQIEQPGKPDADMGEAFADPDTGEWEA